MSEEITFDELMAEIGKLETRGKSKPFSTDEMKLIVAAREREVSWADLAHWWNQKFETNFNGPQLAKKYDHQKR